MKKKKWRPFEEARKFMRSLKLKNQGEWLEYSKSGERPADIPSNPGVIYKKEWKGEGDWLGTGRTRVGASRRASFEKARKFVHSLKLKNWNEWKKYCKSGEKPADISASPGAVYKKEWNGRDDFLGVKKIRKYTKDNTRPFNEAREFVHSLKLKNQMDWKKYLKSGEKPDDIPAAPREIYKEYKGDGDWLGTGTIAAQDREYRSFNESREFARKLGLKSRTEWEEYCKSGEKPDDIPTMITQTYKKEFTSMGDFLGTGTIAPQNRQYRSFQEARKFARNLGLNSTTEWEDYRKSGEKPDDIPYAPWKTYKEFKSMKDWLGTTILSYEEAEKQAHILVIELGIETQDDWEKASREGKIPKNFPAQPWEYYSERYQRGKKK